PDFRNDQEEQKDLYEAQLKYQKLLEELYGVTWKRLLVMQDFLGQAAARPASATVYLPSVHLMRHYSIPLVGPLDGVDDKGVPWISPMVAGQARGIPVQAPYAVPASETPSTPTPAPT